jgi:hypothetical protein
VGSLVSPSPQSSPSREKKLDGPKGLSLKRELGADTEFAGLAEDVGVAGGVFGADALAFEEGDGVGGRTAGELAADDLVEFDGLAPAEDSSVSGGDEFATFPFWLDLGCRRLSPMNG